MLSPPRRRQQQAATCLTLENGEADTPLVKRGIAAFEGEEKPSPVRYNPQDLRLAARPVPANGAAGTLEGCPDVDNC